MNFLTWIDKLKSHTFLQVFTIYLRYLIGGAFVIAAIGMGKLSGGVNILNAKSQPIQDLAPIQQFFRVMMDSGLYWEFIGWGQIIGGLLLMTQRFAKLGAAIFFGMILNIFIITLSYEFKGTPYVTGLMLLAVTYLLVWDIRSYLVLITNTFNPVALNPGVTQNTFWNWLGLIMFVSIIVNMSLMQNMLLHLGIPLIEGLIGFIIYFSFFHKKRVDIIADPSLS